MTEIPAAFFLCLGLWFALRDKTALAFLSFGLMPLARLEACLVMAWCFVVLSLWHLIRRGRTCIGEVFFLNIVGLIPFICWWLAGRLLTNDPSWLSVDYVFPRRFDMGQIARINAVTGLPAVLSPPLLILFVFSALRSPRSCVDTGTSAQRFAPALVWGSIVVHLLFLSSFVVYPRGSGWEDIGISAINARNYITISPLFAVCISVGAAELVEQLRTQARSWISRDMVVSLFVTQGLIIAYFFFGRYALRLSGIVGMGILLANETAFLGFILILALIGSGKLWRSNESQQRTSSLVGKLAVFSIVCLPLSNPVFWYPIIVTVRISDILPR